MDAAEFALRKVVRNNPIAREVDEVWQGELWQWVCVALVLVLVLLFSVLQSARLQTYGRTIQTLQLQRAQEAEAGRHLRLRIEQLRAPKRVEEYATAHLNLVKPGQAEAIVIELVTPPERPAASVLAAR
jgi:hypothetical protein